MLNLNKEKNRSVSDQDHEGEGSGAVALAIDDMSTVLHNWGPIGRQKCKDEGWPRIYM